MASAILLRQASRHRWRRDDRRGDREASSGKPGLHPLLYQRPLELREGAKDMKQELALRCGGVHLLSQRTEGDAARLARLPLTGQTGPQARSLCAISTRSGAF